jgi:hypothetical protein
VYFSSVLPKQLAAAKCACIGRVGCDKEANRFSSCSVLMVVYTAIAGNITRVFQT